MQNNKIDINNLNPIIKDLLDLRGIKNIDEIDEPGERRRIEDI